MDVLREVVAEAEGKLEVFMDGGIRSGSDVFKALAYGKETCFKWSSGSWLDYAEENIFCALVIGHYYFTRQVPFLTGLLVLKPLSQ